MGRRALRKIDPRLDLSRHLRTLDQLPHPWDPRACFGREAALEVEVGSGKGLFLRTAAASRPDVDFLGVEVARKYARFAAAALAKQDLPNALVVLGDALRLFSDILADESVDAVHIYFPDPWWKKRHKKRRILRESFVRDVERVLRRPGQLHIWTDVEAYFLASLKLLAETSRLEGPIEVPPAPAEHNMDYRTHFERRMRLHGQPVFRAEFHKPPAPPRAGAPRRQADQTPATRVPQEGHFPDSSSGGAT